MAAMEGPMRVSELGDFADKAEGRARSDEYEADLLNRGRNLIEALTPSSSEIEVAVTLELLREILGLGPDASIGEIRSMMSEISSKITASADHKSRMASVARESARSALRQIED